MCQNCERIVASEWYSYRSLGNGLSLIEEPWLKPFYRCNMWFIRGRDRDLLIDTGLGHFPLCDHIKDLTERPLLAVATHGHFDHIGGHYEFAERAIHAAEGNLLSDPDPKETLVADYCGAHMFERFPVGWDESAYRVRPAPATRILRHGDVVDLGDRAFEVLHVPGHSPGGIALWDEKTGILFSGDTVMNGDLCDYLHHSNVEAYIASMELLRQLPVVEVHAGHFSSFGPDRYREFIDDYLKTARAPVCPNAGPAASA